MPNVIAYGMLIIWPVITIVIFSQMPARKAIIWSILAAYLILPVRTSFNLPGLPSLDKTTIPNLSVLVCVLMFSGRNLVRLPKSGVVLTLMAVFVLSPIATGFINRAPIILAAAGLPGMSFYDSIAAAGVNAIILIPFVLGYSALSHEKSHADMLKILTVAVLVYSLPILFEIRFSPILHGKIYGVAPFSDFLQSIRFGGYRATVFIGHGLLVATLCAMGAIAAAMLWRMRTRTFSLPAALVFFYLMAILILMKSVGSIILAFAALPVVAFMRPRRGVGVMFVLAAVLLFYPALRATYAFPTAELSNFAGHISASRQQSLDYRFKNENVLLDHANKKPILGWGTWGRNQVFSVTTMNTTARESVTDGTWIIAVGQYGWVGYIALFGLLCYPFYSAFKQRRGFIPLATFGLLAIHLLNLLDLIPNSSLRPITWLIAGALSGLVFMPEALAARSNGQGQEQERRSLAAAQTD